MDLKTDVQMDAADALRHAREQTSHLGPREHRLVLSAIHCGLGFEDVARALGRSGTNIRARYAAHITIPLTPLVDDDHARADALEDLRRHGTRRVETLQREREATEHVLAVGLSLRQAAKITNRKHTSIHGQVRGPARRTHPLGAPELAAHGIDGTVTYRVKARSIIMDLDSPLGPVTYDSDTRAWTVGGRQQGADGPLPQPVVALLEQAARKHLSIVNERADRVAKREKTMEANGTRAGRPARKRDTPWT